MQLIPGRTFTIVRQISDHTDTGVYYVRAIVRNAYTDAILATVTLASKGGQRYSGDFLVPQESSGLGAFISIVTSVYDDSGFVTKSANYGDEENTYLWATLSTGGGSGFSEKFDYRRLRDMIKEEIEKIPKPEKVVIPEFPVQKEYEMRWDDILGAIEKVNTLISKIPTQSVDTTPILSRLDDAVQAIKDKEVTEKADLTPVIEMLRDDGSEERLMNGIIGKLDDIVPLIDSIPLRTEELFKETEQKEKDDEEMRKQKEEDDRNEEELLANTLTS